MRTAKRTPGSISPCSAPRQSSAPCSEASSTPPAPPAPACRRAWSGPLRSDLPLHNGGKRRPLLDHEPQMTIEVVESVGYARVDPDTPTRVCKRNGSRCSIPPSRVRSPASDAASAAPGPAISSGCSCRDLRRLSAPVGQRVCGFLVANPPVAVLETCGGPPGRLRRKYPKRSTQWEEETRPARAPE